MAPETLSAPGTYDPRSDLYGVGAVGYFLLTGKPVFEAGTIAEAFGHHLHSEPVPPSERIGRQLPPDLEAVILRCLRKQMDERPASARELARQLDACGLASPWTRQEAERWWQAFRESGGAPSDDPSLAETVMVDLETRSGRHA